MRKYLHLTQSVQSTRTIQLTKTIMKKIYLLTALAFASLGVSAQKQKMTAKEMNAEVIQKSSLKRIPTTPVEFTEEQLVDIEKMLDKIEDDDDIQQVFTNIA